MSKITQTVSENLTNNNNPHNDYTFKLKCKNMLFKRELQEYDYKAFTVILAQNKAVDILEYLD